MNVFALLTPLDWASIGLALLLVLGSMFKAVKRASTTQRAAAFVTTDPLAAAENQYVGPGSAALALTLLADPAQAAATPLPLDLPVMVESSSTPPALDPVGEALAHIPPGPRTASAGLPGELWLSTLLIIALLVPALLRLLR